MAGNLEALKTLDNWANENGFFKSKDIKLEASMSDLFTHFLLLCI